MHSELTFLSSQLIRTSSFQAHNEASATYIFWFSINVVFTVEQKTCRLQVLKAMLA